MNLCTRNDIRNFGEVKWNLMGHLFLSSFMVIEPMEGLFPNAAINFPLALHLSTVHFESTYSLITVVCATVINHQ